MSLVEQFAAWISVSSRYWIFNWVALAFCLVQVFAPTLFGGARLKHFRFARVLRHSSLFFLALGVTLIVFRWPALFEPKYFNPDEAQALTEAITLTHDPVFPRAFMGGDRMLQAYLLSIPGFFGFALTYAVSRFIGLVLFWTACVATYFAVKTVSGEMAARIAAAVALICFATGVSRDYLSHSTELITLPLIAVSCFLLLRLDRLPEKRPTLTLFLLGLALGSVPFAKIQAVPIALTITALSYVWLFFLNHPEKNLKILMAAVLTLGGLFLPALVLGTYAVTGTLQEFLTIMTINPTAYVELGSPFFENVRQYLSWKGEREWGQERLIVGTIVFSTMILPLWAVRRRHWKDRPWWPFIVAATVLAASWYSLAAPARPFAHYLLHTLIPFCLFSGVLMSRPPAPAKENEDEREDEWEDKWEDEWEDAWEDGRKWKGEWEDAWSDQSSAEWMEGWKDEPKDAWWDEPEDDPTLAPKTRKPRNIPWPHILAVGFILIPLLTLPFDARYKETDRKQIIASMLPDLLKYQPMPASQVVLKLKEPGDSLTVWGWQSDYHVETQLPMGMRVPVTCFLIEDLPLRNLFREINFNVFVERRPTFFIDAVAPESFWYEDPSKYGHEIFPAFAAFIRKNYSHLSDLDGVRLYIRSDRAKEILAGQAAGNREAILRPKN